MADNYLEKKMEDYNSAQPAKRRVATLRRLLLHNRSYQLERLRKRTPNDKMYKRFIDEWIPLEDRYFDASNLRAKANISFDTTGVF